MYSLEIRDHLDKIFKKIGKKNPKQLGIIYKKIAEVTQNPQHYKNLRTHYNISKAFI